MGGWTVRTKVSWKGARCGGGTSSVAVGEHRRQREDSGKREARDKRWQTAGAKKEMRGEGRMENEKGRRKRYGRRNDDE